MQLYSGSYVSSELMTCQIQLPSMDVFQSEEIVIIHNTDHVPALSIIFKITKLKKYQICQTFKFIYNDNNDPIQGLYKSVKTGVSKQIWS